MFAITIPHVSTGLALTMGVVFGALSLVVSARFVHTRGWLPWGIHPALWFIIGFLVGIIGFILCIIAVTTSKGNRSKGPQGPWSYQGGFSHHGVGPEPYGAPGPYPGVGHYPGWGPYGPGPGPYPGGPGPYGAPSLGPPDLHGDPGQPVPGWYADPSGGFDYRYWSGDSWTEHVSVNGVVSVDPVPR
ncbi:MAG: DUF2510 domain-containing protein [Actinobacteria bacterium]|nr:DUF2510 domain-containing protein [Actinomycetota bacterium]MCL5445003.1 DUF2510 domain-containing protein [Actinomycetota bacterium]